MPLTDQDRILRHRLRPRIVALWQAVQALRGVSSFMQSGAHPDDETSSMLAALTFRDGWSISYACANRGEGGQNDIGTEATEALGVLRTAEMERACDVLGMRLYWLSERADDSIFDFGFSKLGTETLDRWGAARTLQRFVEIVRIEKPDVLCPTFLDIPGQHGHHRAMTEMAHLVFDAAADPGFGGVDLPPWEIGKLFLPAWSGAGGSYDDEVPPPPATTHVAGAGHDPVTGWSWARIGQQSRACHRTQGMGRWVPAEHEQADWPLHCVASRVSDVGAGLAEGLPRSLSDLGGGAALKDADAAIAEVSAAFPDAGEMLKSAGVALDKLRRARDLETEDWLSNHGHRLDRLGGALVRIIRLAAGVEVDASLDQDWLRPGETAQLSTSTCKGNAEAVTCRVVLPKDWKEDGGGLRPLPDARISDPYPSSYDPAHPRAPFVAVTITAGGISATTHAALERAPVVLPSMSVRVTPASALINLATQSRTVEVTFDDVVPAGGEINLDTPVGWAVEMTDGQARITLPDGVAEGLYELPVLVNDVPAQSVRRIAHDHTEPRAWCTAARVKLRVVNVALPEGRVGYIGGGNDRVGHWLRALGCDCHDITNAEMSRPDWHDGFSAIVVGIFALRFRHGLTAHMPDLHAFAAEGGTLVTLYHRPWDNWDPDGSAPHRLEIGQPSLRWRVTDETAAVTHLVPDHPLLTTPNRIGPDDWDGWHKERGLYFAKSWDSAYTPLLEMADPGEAPHKGALLVADTGKGRHVHCALILHHQMEKLIPGAFRLMANLLAKR